jgi:ATP-dependent Clp protease ATP-binding subunit ClpA
VEEPSEDAAIRMVRGVAAVLEKHHKVEILDEAIQSAVRLSHRYIPARQLPDKAISLLDTVCARVAVSQHATPAEVEDIERRLQALEVEAAIIARENAVGMDTADRGAVVDAQLAAARDELEAAKARWDAEKVLVDEVLDLRAKLRAEGLPVDDTAPPEKAEAEDDSNDEAAPAHMSTAERARTLETLKAKQAELGTLQGERPLILPSVDRIVVAVCGGRLDRHSRGPHGGVTRLEPALNAGLDPGQARGRPSHGLDDDRQAHPDLALPASDNPGTSRSACSCWPAPRAWAKPKPPWPWPKPCMGASKTSSPST